MKSDKSQREVRSVSSGTVALRDLPYPYDGLLAICSDLDETTDHKTYLEIAAFLNTARDTAMGKGVGLEVGNTMYFDMAPGEYSFWNASDQERDELIQLMRSGHVDCFHSFGDTATSRKHAARALGYIESHNCQLRVWIDHAVAPSNIGADIMQGQGDLAGSAPYHTDLTIPHGVEYVWTGRVTSVIGQGVRRRLGRIGNWRQPVKSFVTIGKEFVKGLLGIIPGSRYAFHRENSLLRERDLRDGQRVLEFFRCNPNPCGVSAGDRGDRLYEALTDQMLDTLVSRRGTSILYTHLGKLTGSEGIFPPQTVAALENLAVRRDAGDVLVASTVRVLDYHRMLSQIQWRCATVDGRLEIHIDSPGQVLDGLTFEVYPSQDVSMFCNGELIDDTERFELRGEAGVAVSIPWRSLTYPL